MELRDWILLGLGAVVSIVTTAVNRAFSRIGEHGERIARLEAVMPTVGQTLERFERTVSGAIDRIDKSFSELRAELSGMRADIHSLWERIGRGGE